MLAKPQSVPVNRVVRESMSMTKILVAYYSRTGFTRTVGRQTASLSMTDQEIQGKRHQDRIRDFAAAIERVACSDDPLRVPVLCATDVKSVNMADLAG